jgi:hypothetical protein
MAKVTMLEGQVNELSSQNRSLWGQINQLNRNDNLIKTVPPMFEAKPELTQASLPMTFSAMNPNNSIPTNSVPFVKNPSMHNVSCYLNLGGSEVSVYSTEASHNSPSLQPTTESDKCFDMSESEPLYSDTPNEGFQFPMPSFTPQVSQIQANDLKISRNEMSVGQMFASWDNNETQNYPSYQDPNSSVLGKRQFGGECQQDNFMPEPMKLCAFNRRNMVSNGTEDMFRPAMAMPVNEDYSDYLYF